LDRSKISASGYKEGLEHPLLQYPILTLYHMYQDVQYVKDRTDQSLSTLKTLLFPTAHQGTSPSGQDTHSLCLWEEASQALASSCLLLDHAYHTSDQVLV